MCTCVQAQLTSGAQSLSIYFLRQFILSAETQRSLISPSHSPVCLSEPPECSDYKRPPSLPSFCGFWGSTLMRLCLCSNCFRQWASPAHSLILQLCWPGTHLVTQASLELTVTLPLSAGIRGVSPESPHLAWVILGWTVFSKPLSSFVKMQTMQGLNPSEAEADRTSICLQFK